MAPTHSNFHKFLTINHLKEKSVKLTLLGTGTSQGVPVIGCDCEVCKSSDPRDNRLRTAGLFSIGRTNIAIDIGPDFRQQMLRAKVKDLHAVLMTHEHNDHVIGLDDVRPFNFKSGRDMKIFATESVQAQIKLRFGYAFAENPYPGSPRLRLKTISKEQPFEVEGISITPIEAMHGKLPVLGFRIGDITYMTDVKTITETERKKIKGSKILVMSALHHRRHHSHLNLEEALELIDELKPDRAYLTHFSHQMGLHAEISKQLPANVEMGYDGLELSI